MDMSFDYSPDWVAFAWCMAFAAAFFGAAVLVTIRRRVQSSRPGCLVWFLLILTMLALVSAWEAYHPSCPRGWWC